MDWALTAVQFVHIAAGALWLGASAFMNLVVLPTIFEQPFDRQRSLLARVARGPERLMIGVALVAVFTGVLRGTVFGPIRSFEALTTSYGIVWLLAIALTVAVFATAGMVTSRGMRTLIRDDDVWVETQGTAGEGYRSAASRVRLGFRLELLGLLGLLGLMTVLRFGA